MNQQAIIRTDKELVELDVSALDARQRRWLEIQITHMVKSWKIKGNTLTAHVERGKLGHYEFAGVLQSLGDSLSYLCNQARYRSARRHGKNKQAYVNTPPLVAVSRR